MKDNGLVVLIEDNKELNIANCRALKIKGYSVLAAQNLLDAEKILSSKEPDIILLDIMLPDGDGMDFCKKIRRKTMAHILFLTAKTEHDDVVKGLLSGGDDYITKPFHPEELIAKIDAVMRRRDMAMVSEKIIKKGQLSLDAETFRVFVGKEELLPTPKEFALLLLMVKSKGEFVDKKFLYEQVWKQPMAGDSSALRQNISRLRKKLEEVSKGSMTITVSRNDGYGIENRCSNK